MPLNSLLSNKAFKLFVVLAGFFVANTLVAEFIGVKIFSLEASLGIEPFLWNILGVDNLGFNLTAGVLLWPVVFVMTDIINEYFGMKSVKLLSYLAVGLIFYAFFMVYGSMALSPNEWWTTASGKLGADSATHVENMDLAYNKVFGQGLWIIIGSMVAFLVGQVVDVAVFHKIKQKTGEKRIWLRATGSTLVSQFIDSYVVLLIAFYIGSDWELVRVLAIGTVNYIYKFVVAVLLTPVIYLAHHYIDKYLGKSLAEKLKRQAAES